MLDQANWRQILSILCKVALPSLIVIRFWGQLHLHRQSRKKISNLQTKLEFDLKEMTSVQDEPTKYFPWTLFKVLRHRLIPMKNLIFLPPKNFSITNNSGIVFSGTKWLYNGGWMQIAAEGLQGCNPPSIFQTRQWTSQREDNGHRFYISSITTKITPC